jgi:hypothetical protein
MTSDEYRDLKFSHDLMEWFWNHGVERSSKYPAYAIPTDDWLKKLYDTRKDLETINQAAKRTRPACAIWGPSQTGKSTLVAAYLDEKAEIVGVPGKDGVGGALHWPGGDPALFMFPKAMGRWPSDDYTAAQVLNPYNQGKDASACLTRFVYGSSVKNDNYHHVFDPKHPIQVRLVSKKELLHAVARGFDTECWGHSPSGKAKEWDIDRLVGELNKVPDGDDDAKPNKEAYECLHDFCEVLDDLVFASISRFKDLASNERKYQSTVAAILGKKQLICNHARASEFVARVLWEECEDVTRYYEKMRLELDKYEKQWAGKTVYCSIPTATLLLDMDVYEILKLGKAAPPKNFDQINKLVCNLGWKEDDNNHVILDQSLDKRVFEGDIAEKFAILQGLVWEIVVPLNPDHLGDTPFRKYLQNADLLDFPGVGRKVTTLGERMKCECKFREAADGSVLSSATAQKPPAFDADHFFVYLLKRGKTASIISTYAKSLTIDGFAIFTNLDGDPVANAEQLQTGIMTWWRAMAPDYFKNNEGKPSPLPLILGLLWWRKVFEEINYSQPSLGNYVRLWDALGKLQNPDIVTTYAMNYHSLPKGKPNETRSQEEIGKMLERLQQEEVFKKQFNTDESRESFRNMWSDRKTGGATFFFEKLASKIGNKQNGASSRSTMLETKRKINTTRLQDLIDAPNLFPPPEERDPRVENLREWRDFLVNQIKKGKFNEARMRTFNHALRVFLNVNADDLSPIPASAEDITEQHIEEQYKRWISRKVDRYRSTAIPVPGAAPSIEWDIIGVINETKCRDYLTALVASLKPAELLNMTRWLRQLVKSGPGGDCHYEPYLAVRMSNALLYENKGRVPTFDGSTATEPYSSSEATVFSGVTCPSYKVFVKDFINVVDGGGRASDSEPTGRLSDLIQANVPKQVMPVDLPGVEPLKQLCVKYSWTPKIYAAGT